MNRLQSFYRSYHPIVHTLLAGTVMARAASSMSMPFLALYLARTTDMSPFLIGVVIGLGSLAGTFGGFIGGTLSDRVGRRLVMLTALYVWGFVFLGFGTAGSPLLFLLLNMANGLCRSFYEPVSQALMADLTPADKRFRVFSLRYLAINIGVAVGPLLGAYLGTVSGGLPFLLTGGVYLLYALLLQRLLNRFGIRRIEGEKKQPLTFGAAWAVIRRDSAFRLFLGGGMLAAVGYSQMTVTLSQYLEGLMLEEGVKLFAWMMSVNAITVVVCQVPLVSWLEKRSPLFAIACGSVLFALGDLGFAYSTGTTAFLVSMVVFSLGEILSFPAGNLLIDRIAPREMRGTYYGAQSFQNFGHFVGPWLGGLLLTEFGGHTMFLIMAVFTLLSIWFYRAGELSAGGRAKARETGAGEAG
ncbi:MFS transporter [Paenibacillus sp. J31TS4]|uniref:MDR family MFS transporter n=1 Tax=Paenibacillus sp. J31TS4 TaxID=2807195 RepID=UPI001B13AF54|nr:MFS transporter [Paenibacillus sp. J31TS4]GIP38079.1 MFS transporter [Paenibacillus sp. J31TS4]